MQKVGHHEAHSHGAGVPAAGRQGTKHRGLGRFVVQVKGLRVKLGGEGDDLFAGGRDGAQIAHLAHSHVFPEVFDLCHQRPPEMSIKLMVV